jgi:hypothetical protein
LGAAFGTLSASPLTDTILEPMLDVDGVLANSIGRLIETSPGRGIGFLMIMEGVLMLFVSIILFNYFYFQHIDEELLVGDRKTVENL